MQKGFDRLSLESDCMGDRLLLEVKFMAIQRNAFRKGHYWGKEGELSLEL